MNKNPHVVILVPLVVKQTVTPVGVEIARRASVQSAQPATGLAVFFRFAERDREGESML